MPDYIDRSKVIPAIMSRYEPIDATKPMTLSIVHIAEVLLAMEPADVVPVKYGEWEETDWVELDAHGLETTRTPKAGLRCSRCSHVFKKELLWEGSYCPKCGAFMHGKEGGK